MSAEWDSQSVVFCPHCGYRLLPPAKGVTCSECGKFVEEALANPTALRWARRLTVLSWIQLDCALVFGACMLLVFLARRNLSASALEYIGGLALLAALALLFAVFVVGLFTYDRSPQEAAAARRAVIRSIVSVCVMAAMIAVIALGAQGR